MQDPDCGEKSHDQDYVPIAPTLIREKAGEVSGALVSQPTDEEDKQRKKTSENSGH